MIIIQKIKTIQLILIKIKLMKKLLSMQKVIMINIQKILRAKYCWKIKIFYNKLKLKEIKKLILIKMIKYVLINQILKIYIKIN